MLVKGEVDEVCVVFLGKCHVYMDMVLVACQAFAPNLEGRFVGLRYHCPGSVAILMECWRDVLAFCGRQWHGHGSCSGGPHGRVTRAVPTIMAVSSATSSSADEHDCPEYSDLYYSIHMVDSG